MLLRSWLTSLRHGLTSNPFTGSRRATGRRSRRRGVAQVESLEARMLLAAVTWDGGGGDTNWQNQLNWDGDAIPTTADDVTIGSQYAGLTVVSTADVEVNTIQSEADLLILESRFTIGSDSSFTGLIIEHPNSELSGSGDITVTGLLDWRDGTLSGSGAVHAQGGIRINDSGQRDLVLDGRTLNNVATAVWESGSVDLLNDALIHISGATFEAQHDGP